MLEHYLIILSTLFALAMGCILTGVFCIFTRILASVLVFIIVAFFFGKLIVTTAERFGSKND